MSAKLILVTILIVVGVAACTREVMQQAFQGFSQPSNFPVPVYNFENNPITEQGFALGKKLFYDPILSVNNSISCGSCHIQTSAFTHHGHIVSHGIFDRMGTRNSPAIMNLAWNTSFMWDGGVADLDLQPIIPITSSVEMGDSLYNVLNKLRSSTDYRAGFKKAFGTDEINTVRFLKALSQFMLMCTSDNSKYDSLRRNQTTFTALEDKGYAIFKTKCNNCHKEPLFTDYSFRNNGLSISQLDDRGRYSVTENQSDKYKFKVPSLRNLSYTAPYMHDGRLLTLDAVLEHYNSFVEITENIDPLLNQTPKPGIVLSTEEKQAIIAFLKTLDDRSFITNKLLSE